MMIQQGGIPGTVQGVDRKGNERTFSLEDYKGRYLVCVCYTGDWEGRELIQSFAQLEEEFRSQDTECVGCSTDSAKCHSTWIRTDRDNDGFGGKLGMSLWSDPIGLLPSQWGLYDEEEGICREGVVLIDTQGEVRQILTTSLGYEDTAHFILDEVKHLKKSETDDSRVNSRPRTTDWEITKKSELQSALSDLLGQPPAPTLVYSPISPVFDLIPSKIRKLTNPRSSLYSCSASLQRNLVGFENRTTDERLRLEEVVRKVLQDPEAPDILKGTYTNLKSLPPKSQSSLLSSEVFKLTGDNWMKEGSSVRWNEGAGVFINQQENLVIWVNREDDIKVVSMARGQDLKYILLRLHKAIFGIESMLKNLGHGFLTRDGGFPHFKKEVGRSGLQVEFLVSLPGLTKVDTGAVAKAGQSLGLVVEQVKGNQVTVVLKQNEEDTEYDIVTRSVTSVDKLWRLDQELQSRAGTRLII